MYLISEARNLISMYLEAKMTGKRILEIPIPETYSCVVEEMMYMFKDRIKSELKIEKIGPS